MSENIRVKVTSHQIVRYDQIIEFTPDEWRKFKDREAKAQCGEIEDRLDLRNIHDADSIEQFHAVVVGDEKDWVEA